MNQALRLPIVYCLLVILVKLQKLSLHGFEQAKYLRGLDGQHDHQRK